MIRINLLPVRQGASAQAGKQVLVIFAVLLIAEAAGLFYYQSGKDAELAVAQARNRKLSAEIKKLTTQTKKIDQLEKEAVELEQQQLVLDGLVDGQTGPVRVLAALATLLSPIEVAEAVAGICQDVVGSSTAAVLVNRAGSDLRCLLVPAVTCPIVVALLEVGFGKLQQHFDTNIGLADALFKALNFPVVSVFRGHGLLVGNYRG